MPPVVCKFWQQGTCRNGDRCKFLHTNTNTSNPNHQPVSSGNRYAALQGDNYSSRNSNNGYQNGGARTASPARDLPYSLDKKAILLDLTSEKPQWILSAYGPGRHAPAQLFGGPMREHSFEEMRLLHYMAVAAGNPQQAIQEAEKLWRASEQQIQTAVSNVDGAINFIVNSEKDHPNRIDIVRGGQAGPGSQPNPFNTQSSFQQPPTSTPNPFGGPSQSQPPPAFGAPTAPAFGAPTALGGAFGQPSALGQKTNAFGGANPAFGAPTQLGSGGAFGQPSALGQKANPYGASTASSQAPAAAPFSSFAGTSTPFGQKPAFGAPTQPAARNSFGAPSQPAASNTFGALSNSFGAPSQTAQAKPFGQSSNSNPKSNPFGGQSKTQANPLAGPQPGFGEPSPAKNPFGAPSQASQTPFGAPTASQTNPFVAAAPAPSTANPFGAPSNPTQNPNPFGAPSNPTQNANPFGPPATTGPSSNGNPFASQSQSQLQPATNGHGPNAQLGAQHPEIASYSSKDASGRLTMFKGKRVMYKDNEPGFTGPDGSWERIWFPDGPPIFNKDTQVDESMYDDKTEAAYLHAKQTGTFLNGMMPLLPPKREWCTWDF
ncbi:hypothetical protein BKA65DRAFT_9311 [Rhexocercosporidium sp. MPI-PUGE-AT-0058]|nr:hypothetical protein BKA65DRAFT_9311 [Rhexocercosporidium sp. MPI-PUGE-AT-0058]